MSAPGPPLRRADARYLLPSERLVVSVRRHPVILLRYFLEVVVALVVAGRLTALTHGHGSDLIWWLFIAVVARAVWMALEWSNDRFLVTDRRIMLVSGLLTQRVAMMPLRKVTDLTYERPVGGRILGYGTFVLESAGQDQALHTIKNLPSPDTLYTDVSQLIFGAGGIAGPKVVPLVEED